MNERQSFILNALVTEYVKTAKPVGSSALLRATDLDVSPATVRNDMKQLEEEGFLAQPHTSAGRVPTDTGYREYVNSLLAHRRRAQQYNERLAQELIEAREREKFLSLALAHVLARRSGAVGVSQSDEKLRSTHQGFASLLEAPEFRDSKSVAGVARTLEKIDEILGEYVDDVALHEGALSPRAVVISIGQENPVEELRSCALLMSPYEDVATGQRGVIALLGPTRMAYQQNISLLEQVRSVLGSRGAMMGAGMLLIISIV